MQVFENLTTPNEHPICNQNGEIDCLIRGDFAFGVVFEI